MHKKLIILAAIILMSASATQTMAAEIKIGKDVTIGSSSTPAESTVKNKLDKLAEPYDDVKLSDEVSAGIITEHDDLTMENNHGLPTDEKGQEVGVGISLSF